MEKLYKKVFCFFGWHHPISITKYYNNKKEYELYCSDCNKILKTETTRKEK